MRVKKILAAIISAAMVLTTMAFPAFAEDSTAAAEVSTAQDLETAVADAAGAAIIKLTDNIKLDQSLVIGEDKEITLDLNGKTLSIEEAQDEKGVAVWYNTIKNSGKLTVTGNGTVEGQWNAISSYSGATLIIDNGKFIGIHNYGLYNAGTVTVKSGTFESNPDAWDFYNEGGNATVNGGSFDITGVFNSGILNITNGSFESALNFYVCEISGGTFKKVSVKSDADSKITGGIFDIGENSWNKEFIAAIENGNNTDNVKFTKQAAEAFATVKESKSSNVLFAATNGYKFGDTAGEDNYYTITKVGTAVLSINTAPVGGEIKSSGGLMKFLGNTGKLPSSKNITKGYTLTKGIDFQNVMASAGDEYDFNGWYIKADGSESAELITMNAVLDSFTMPQQDAYLYAEFAESEEKVNVNKTYPTWIADYNSKDSFTVSSTVEMACFAKAVNEGYDFSGKTVTLTEDLDYSGKKYTPVGDDTTDTSKKYTHVFKGTFDGKNHTISNIISDQQYKYAGVFGNMNGTVENLKVKDSTIYTEITGGYAGGIAAEALGTIKNCSAENVNVSGYYAGGIAGHSFGITIANAEVKNIKGNGFKSGAVIGYADALTLKDTVVSQTAADSGLGASLVGHINAGTHNISNLRLLCRTEKSLLMHSARHTLPKKQSTFRAATI